MSGNLRHRLGNLSRLLNRLTGGTKGQSLCARVADAYGQRCLFCRLVGGALREPAHCADQLLRWRSVSGNSATSNNHS
jgi:hypothetical protein